MHIKACLATGNKPAAWRKEKMFIPANGKVIYIQAKAYRPIIPLSFMQKTMQKFIIRNVKVETMGNVPYIYNNLLTKQGSSQNPQYSM
jgi:hypothetical protein